MSNQSPSKSAALSPSETKGKEDIPLKLKKPESKEARLKSKESRSKEKKKKEKEAITNADDGPKEGSKNRSKASVVSQTLESESKSNVEGADVKVKTEAIQKKAEKSETRRSSRGAADQAKKRMSSQSKAQSDDDNDYGSDEKAERKKIVDGKGSKAFEPSSDFSEDDADEDDEWYENKTRSMKPGKENDVKKNDREVKTESDADDQLLVIKKKAPKKAETKADGKQKPKSGSSKKRSRDSNDEEDDDEFTKRNKTPSKKVKDEKIKPEALSGKKRKKNAAEANGGPEKKKKKVKEEPEIWKWWEEDRLADGVKWRTLSHKGPYFAPPYERLPDSVHILYKRKPVKLSPLAEETAGFYARMLDHEYTSKPVFRDNFWTDWRKVMTSEEREKITKFDHCDFTAMSKYFVEKAEERKQMSKEEKKKLKEQNEALQVEYGFCMIDGHKQKIGNWKIEPPGLFRGRGEHPKMGKLKRRIHPEDVTINIGKEAELPTPPSGRWGEIRHDNKVTWLATWLDTVNGERKYVLLNAASHLKGEKDWQKYEMARKLKGNVERIREEYKNDWKSKLMQDRQRGVAVYFIDKLALRAGNEKDTDEEADTVGCCSLRVEHIRLHDTWEGKEHVVEFDFLGKDSIRYVNHVAVEKQVFKNLKRFMEQKDPGDDLFDRITTSSLNKHLQTIMPGLTAKVFRTYNASITLQEQLKALTEESMSPAERLLAYNRANRQVAILCNHQRSVPKMFEKQMERLGDKIKEKEEKIAAAAKELKSLKKSGKDASELEKKKNAIGRLKTQLHKLEVQQTDKEENKTIALGTSKLNYLDPRITVAWCKKFDAPLEKIYTKTQREKFAWAIHMADETFEF